MVSTASRPSVPERPLRDSGVDPPLGATNAFGQDDTGGQSDTEEECPSPERGSSTEDDRWGKRGSGDRKYRAPNEYGVVRELTGVRGLRVSVDAVD